MLLSRTVRIAIPTHEGRVSPVCDVARRFVVVETQDNCEIARTDVVIEPTALIDRARQMTSLRWEVLICGAISCPFEAMLAASGMRVIANTCGPVQDVLTAFLSGEILRGAFRMPGCGCRARGRRRHRGGRTT
jgi:predicted Fe-Mo cluster-binding NifX family protein